MDKEFANFLAHQSNKENLYRMITPPSINYSGEMTPDSALSVEPSIGERRPRFGDSTNAIRSDRQFPLKKRIRDNFDSSSLASGDPLTTSVSGNSSSPQISSALSWEAKQNDIQPLDIKEISTGVLISSHAQVSVDHTPNGDPSKIRTGPLDEEVIDIEGTDVVDTHSLVVLPANGGVPLQLLKKRKVVPKPRKNGGPKHTVIVTLKGEDFDKSPMKSRIPNPSNAVQKRARVSGDENKRAKKGKKKVLKEELSELCNVLEMVWKRMRDHPDAYPFLAPVQAKHAPDYYSVITKPMDLRTIHEKLVRYKNHREFLGDVKQMIRNCHLYNKDRNPELPPMADALYKVCKSALREMRKHIVDLEKKSDYRSKLTAQLPPSSSSSTVASIWDDPNIDVLTSSPLSTPDEESEFVDIDDTLESVINS